MGPGSSRGGMGQESGMGKGVVWGETGGQKKVMGTAIGCGTDEKCGRGARIWGGDGWKWWMLTPLLPQEKKPRFHKNLNMR